MPWAQPVLLGLEKRKRRGAERIGKEDEEERQGEREERRVDRLHSCRCL